MLKTSQRSRYAIRESSLTICFMSGEVLLRGIEKAPREGCLEASRNGYLAEEGRRRAYSCVAFTDDFWMCGAAAAMPIMT